MGRGDVVIDQAGIEFWGTDVPVCDIFIEGRRIMSVSPADQQVAATGRHNVPWPAPLRPYLRGIGHISVREHVSGVVHYDGEVRFSDSRSRVRVVDKAGHPLVVAKWGRLERSFADSDDVQQQIELTARVLRDLNDIGVAAYIAYGTLLGAMRSGNVIGHDTDADVSYLSRHSHPADIARESFHLQREMLKRGWKIERGRLGKIVVAELHKVDIFVSYFVGDSYSLDQWVEGPLRRDQIVPLSTVALEGYDLPAPADPEAVLALNYGPDWRIPDPSFKYDVSLPHRARTKGWFGSHSTSKANWNTYWTSSSQASKPDPSPFASWVAARIDKKSVLLDIGCGRGTDTLLLAKRGMKAIGYDYADLALRKARNATPIFSRSRVQFKRMSIADTRVTVAEGARLAATPGTKTVVARLVLDALSHEGYSNFWLLLRLATARGGDAFLEFRASTGNPMKGTKRPMWRRLVDVDNVKSRLAKIGGSITEEQLVDACTATGAPTSMHRLAVHFDPPPHHR